MSVVKINDWGKSYAKCQIPKKVLYEQAQIVWICSPIGVEVQQKYMGVWKMRFRGQWGKEFTQDRMTVNFLSK